MYLCSWENSDRNTLFSSVHATKYSQSFVVHALLFSVPWLISHHYSDVIMSTMVSQITSLTIVCSTVYSGTDQRKHQSSTSLAFVRGIHRWPVNSPHKWPIMRKMFPFDDVIMIQGCLTDTGAIIWLPLHQCQGLCQFSQETLKDMGQSTRWMSQCTDVVLPT